MSVEELYQDLIIDHHKNPRHRGEIATPFTEQTVYNPLCGDQIRLLIGCDGDRVVRLGFTGKGCAISQSSASILTELCLGRTLAEVAAIESKFRALLEGRLTEVEANELGDAVALAGVRRFPARVRCALIAWEALGLLLPTFSQKHASAEPTK